MGSEKASWRVVLSLLVAVVFAVAAMAMPAQVPNNHAKMDDCAQHAKAMHCCDHDSGLKSADKHMPGKDSPCKNMAACLGMLSCFSMAAVDFVVPQALVPPRDAPVAFAHQTVSGLTHRPDHPPPIV